MCPFHTTQPELRVAPFFYRVAQKSLHGTKLMRDVIRPYLSTDNNCCPMPYTQNSTGAYCNLFWIYTAYLSLIIHYQPLVNM